MLWDSIALNDANVGYAQPRNVVNRDAPTPRNKKLNVNPAPSRKMASLGMRYFCWSEFSHGILVSSMSSFWAVMER